MSDLYDCIMDSQKDTISSFPDEILALILSFLPTKLAACTSILSKRWKNLFPLMTHLFASQHRIVLDDSDILYPEEEEERKHIHQKSYSVFLEKTLSGSNSIKKISIKFRDQDHPLSFEYMHKLINNVLQRGVVDLDLRLKSSSLPSNTRLLSNVLSSTTLVKLTLELDSRRIYYLEGSLPVLKILSLHGILHRCETFYRRVLPGCPILEELSLNYYSCGDDDSANNDHYISHKTLKRLTVHYDSSLYISRVARYKTPSLVYLDYSGLVPLSNPASKFSRSLVQAKLDVHVQSINNVCTDLLPTIDRLRHVKTLSLSSTSVKVWISSSLS